jgi:YD repeat-containing protein
MSDGQTIAVEVTGIEQVTPLIKHFTLAPIGGGALPAFSGGSHIVVVMRGEAAVRRVHRNPYSLLSPPHELDTYQIACGAWRSRAAARISCTTGLQVGSGLEIAHPVNLFALDKIARKHLLIAGGIGITPILAQLEDLHGGAIPYELHYSVRAPEHAAFLARLRAREGERVRMYYDSEGHSSSISRAARRSRSAPTSTSAARPA